MNSIIYARFSPRPNAAECESIETQLERCRAQCVAKGWTIITEHQDRELSGARADNRPGLQAALTDACEHKAVLVVYSLSRLARNTRDAIEIADRLSKCGAEMYSLHESIDTTSAMGRFTFTLFAALAALEREQIGERTSDAMQRHQAAGRRMSSNEPYGYMRDPANPAMLIVNTHEQEIIKEIVQLKDQGLKLRQIVRHFNEKKRTCRGGNWHHTTVAKIIQRATSF